MIVDASDQRQSRRFLQYQFDIMASARSPDLLRFLMQPFKKMEEANHSTKFTGIKFTAWQSFFVNNSLGREEIVAILNIYREKKLYVPSSPVLIQWKSHWKREE